MQDLDEGNLPAYLARVYPAFDQSGPVRVHYIGDAPDANPCEGADAPEDSETGGFINYIFRVSNDTQSLIVKQARATSRVNEGIVLSTSRNRREYESLLLRSTIVPQYVPRVYHADVDNATFVMEDVSYLKQARNQLIVGHTFPRLGSQVGEYVAANSFYLSEFYLDADQFRQLAGHFRNSDMREVMESWVFLRDAPYLTHAGNLELKKLIDHDAALNVRCYELRHSYMTHAEALVHGDLHTSNMFVDDERLKVIDMEYTFAGPLCYDIGYFLGSILTQWCTGVFRDFPTSQDKRAFLSYVLDTMVQAYETFTSKFAEHWHADAKPVYRGADGFLSRLEASWLPDVLGYLAVPCLPAITTNPYPECMQLGEQARVRAQELCLVICRHLLVEGARYSTMREAVDAIARITDIYLASL